MGRFKLDLGLKTQIEPIEWVPSVQLVPFTMKDWQSTCSVKILEFDYRAPVDLFNR